MNGGKVSSTGCQKLLSPVVELNHHTIFELMRLYCNEGNNIQIDMVARRSGKYMTRVATARPKL